MAWRAETDVTSRGARRGIDTRVLRGVAAALLLAAAACGDDGVAPTEIVRVDLVGRYSATTLELHEEDGDIDLLEEGIRISGEIHPDGTTGGVMSLPGFGEVSLAGTFTFDEEEDVVRWDPEDDTVLTDITLRAVRESGTIVLDGTGVFFERPVSIVLARE